MSRQSGILVQNAQQVVLVCNNGEKYLTRKAMQDLAVLHDASLVIGRNGLIEAVGTVDAIQSQYQDTVFDRVIDASGMCVLPGLVDAHTHPVWVGDRVHEFAMKLAGASYMEIHNAGGGIHFTVEHTRKASEEELFECLKKRLQRMIRAGSTLVECKSGYGLNLETETKMLRVIDRARRELDIDISSTYCGGHSIPKGKTVEETVHDITNTQLPKLKQLMLKGEVHIDNIDVFCEKGVFDLESTSTILQAGKEMGLHINFHGDELHPMKAGELGAKLKALAISHLEEVSDDGINDMAIAKSSAVLLPTTAYILRLKSPRARDMLEAGVIVALGSDFNPNAYCFSMPMIMHMACVNMKMSMSEALAAATINAAYSLGRSQTHGSLEVGKRGDLIIINSPRWEHLIYQFGAHQELIQCVIVRGKVAYENKNCLGYY
ncbi:probable imidazolonepropionase [Callorhinchus milii]|uniref:Probable imidazolonepropionase n=1 Tax=Callorhinchus milii TaxID=7868 RepID=A0A4W3J815_CALMI|nr:probable imidazolonepropionase [Callorhinchus milii]|eukprot:gi/632980833/ref/XP_007907255.1/ PREDICTED: probable imidazolonepropionase isoform X1 [Callorhinchus milii]